MDFVNKLLGTDNSIMYAYTLLAAHVKLRAPCPNRQIT